MEQRAPKEKQFGSIRWRFTQDNARIRSRATLNPRAELPTTDYRHLIPDSATR